MLKSLFEKISKSLLNKTLFYISITFIILIVTLVMISRFLLVSTIYKSEETYAKKDMERVKNIFANEIGNLNNFCSDYAVWDDTYNYMKNFNQDYISSNYEFNSTFKKNRVNFIVMLDVNNKVVYSKSVMLNQHQQNMIIKDINDVEFKNSFLNDRNNNSNKISGVITIDRYPLMIVCQPIIKSDGSGPSDGYLLMGRIIDKSETDYLSKMIGLKISAFSPEDGELYEDAGITSKELLESKLPLIIRNDKQNIAAYDLINDINGKPAAIFRIDNFRDIYKEGQKIMYFYFALLLFIIVSLLSVIIVIIRNSVLQRLSTLNENVNYITENTDLSLRISVKGNDEVTNVGKAINSMLDALKDSHEKLRESEHKYHYLFRNMYDSCSYNKIILDEENKPVDFIVLEANDAFAKEFHTSKEEVRGKKITELIPGIQDENIEFVNIFAKVALNKENIKIDEVYLKSVKAWFSINAYSIEQGYFVLVHSNITHKKKSEEKIRNLAFYDGLTGLPNRKYFDNQVRVALETAKAEKSLFAVMFLDLDNFKSINDSLGHNAGDYVLREVSRRIKDAVNGKGLVARQGGDEFTIIQQPLKYIGQAEELGKQILSALKPPIIYKGADLYIGTSIGICIHPYDGDDVHKLLRNADIAMYSAKKSGGYNYQFYSLDMSEIALEQLNTTNRLYHAIEKNELMLHYQPQVEVGSGRIIGVEALLRWIDSERGLISPGVFIPAAERTGIIVPIGEWVLRNACAQCKKWRDEGKDISVTVNVSYRQMQQQDFVKMVQDVLEETGLEPCALGLEITESIVIQNLDITISTLNELRYLGIKVLLDDFGTGYSSLSYLGELPIDTLKIDKSFVRDMNKQKKQEDLLKAIIAMAHSLNLTVVAEGVETEEELSILTKYNCDEIQGYIFSKPLPKEIITSFMEENALIITKELSIVG